MDPNEVVREIIQRSRRHAMPTTQAQIQAHYLAPQTPVGSKLKCPVFVASEMSGFKVVPSPIGLG
jgi:hypothetical protein